MAWGEEDYYDGSKTQGHDLGVTHREARGTAELAEYLMTTQLSPDIDRTAVLREFGFAEIKGAVANFFLRIIGKRSKRPTEVAAFFVLRQGSNPGVRFIGFSSLNEYRKNKSTIEEALSITALFAQQA